MSSVDAKVSSPDSRLPRDRDDPIQSFVEFCKLISSLDV